MEKLAQESLAREQAASAEEGESQPVVTAEVEAKVSEVEEPEEEPAAAAPGTDEKASSADSPERDYASMSAADKAYYSLLDSGALNADK